MALPRLLHPVPTRIKQIRTDKTIYDNDYREPVQQVARDEEKTVPGQWKWGLDRELRSTKSGPEEGSRGYVLFRLIDLEKQSVKIQRGDQITGYGSGRGRVDLDVYIVELEYIGHYPDQVGPSMVKAFFNDRQPGRQSPGG